MALARSNESVLSGYEKRVLRWLAERLPAWVTPDKLTIVGLCGAAITLCGWTASQLSPYFIFVGSFGIVVNWFGDSLDGTLARYRRIERPRYGFFIDHSADLITQVGTGLGMGLSPYMHMSAAALVLAAYLSFAAYTFIKVSVFEAVQIAYLSVGPTETRLILIAFSIAVFFYPPLTQPILGDASPLDLAAYGVATFAFCALIALVYKDWAYLRSRGVSREMSAAPSVETLQPHVTK